MAAAVHSLVHETTTSTGTGNLTVTVANGKRSFNTAFGTGGTDVFYYFITHQSAAEYEWGTGHLSASTTLVRDTVIGSSNSNAAVNFSAGTKDVTCDIPAANQIINPLTTRGDIITRGASVPGRLATGSVGQKLYSDGTDPSWKGGLVQIGTATPSAVATSEITSIPATFGSLMVVVEQVSCDTAGRFPRLWVGNGGSYDTTSANYYDSIFLGGSSAGLLGGSATATLTAAQVKSSRIVIHAYARGTFISLCSTSAALTAGTTTWVPANASTIGYSGRADGSPVDCLKLDWSGSGNFDNGTWTVYGMV